jgi:hypothetical protein
MLDEESREGRHLDCGGHVSLKTTDFFLIEELVG